LVNNAGFGLAGYFLEHTLEEELRLLDVNCRAPLVLTHVFGHQMAQRKRGGIIFVSSVSGYIATPFEANYAASKVYELFLAESLGYEFKKNRVRYAGALSGLDADGIPRNRWLTRGRCHGGSTGGRIGDQKTGQEAGRDSWLAQSVVGLLAEIHAAASAYLLCRKSHGQSRRTMKASNEHTENSYQRKEPVS
jgi:NAD(P)-dependent dehydrogenase (short-subunit alcohol dehydrogenase family)